MFGLSKSDSENESDYSQSIDPGQLPYAQQMWNTARNMTNTANRQMQNLYPGAVSNMQGVYDQSNPAWQNQMAGGVYQNMGLQDSLMSSMNQTMNNPSNMSQMNAMIMGGEGNNYADAMKDSLVRDAQFAREQMQGNTNAQAAGSLMSGGSRHGIRDALDDRYVNDALQRGLTDVGYNTFDKDLTRKMDIARQADTNVLANQNRMQKMLAAQQNTMSQGLGFGSNMQDLNMGQYAPSLAPQQTLAGYVNAVGPLSQSSTGSSSGSSSAIGGSFG